MREIEFRAWNKYHKKMYPVYMINFESDLVYCKGDDYSGHTFGKIDCEIMQFTETEDHLGTKVFEGDIVFLDAKMITGIVVMDYLAWKIKDGDDFYWLCDFYEDVQVIGNIHQNPDLLEK